MFEFFVTRQGATAFASLPPMNPEQEAAWDRMIEGKRVSWTERRRRRLAAGAASTVAPEDAATAARPPFAVTEYERVAAHCLHAYLDMRATDLRRR